MLLFQGLKNRNKNKTINNQIAKLNTELIDKKLFISFIGKEFEGNPKYLWNIKIGSKEVNITSKKSIIALSKSNTKKYLDNGGAIVSLQIETYKSPIFQI